MKVNRSSQPSTFIGRRYQDYPSTILRPHHGQLEVQLPDSPCYAGLQHGLKIPFTYYANACLLPSETAANLIDPNQPCPSCQPPYPPPPSPDTSLAVGNQYAVAVTPGLAGQPNDIITIAYLGDDETTPPDPPSTRDLWPHLVQLDPASGTVFAPPLLLPPLAGNSGCTINPDSGIALLEVPGQAGSLGQWLVVVADPPCQSQMVNKTVVGVWFTQSLDLRATAAPNPQSYLLWNSNDSNRVPHWAMTARNGDVDVAMVNGFPMIAITASQESDLNAVGIPTWNDVKIVSSAISSVPGNPENDTLPGCTPLPSGWNCPQEVGPVFSARPRSVSLAPLPGGQSGALLCSSDPPGFMGSPNIRIYQCGGGSNPQFFPASPQPQLGPAVDTPGVFANTAPFIGKSVVRFVGGRAYIAYPSPTSGACAGTIGVWYQTSSGPWSSFVIPTFDRAGGCGLGPWPTLDTDISFEDYGGHPTIAVLGWDGSSQSQSTTYVWHSCFIDPTYGCEWSYPPIKLTSERVLGSSDPAGGPSEALLDYANSVTGLLQGRQDGLNVALTHYQISPPLQ